MSFRNIIVPGALWANESILKFICNSWLKMSDSYNLRWTEKWKLQKNPLFPKMLIFPLRRTN